MSQPDASSPVVSVIVVSYNTCCLLARCLDSLDASAAPPVIEVLVVDNASADGSAEMAVSYTHLKEHARLATFALVLGFIIMMALDNLLG